jgi:hypothetical protein
MKKKKENVDAVADATVDVQIKFIRFFRNTYK